MSAVFCIASGESWHRTVNDVIDGNAFGVGCGGQSDKLFGNVGAFFINLDGDLVDVTQTQTHSSSCAEADAEDKHSTGIASVRGVRALAAGHRHALALTEHGDVFVWGFNDAGQLGVDTDTQTLSMPRLLKPIATEHVVRVCAGFAHSLALTNVGRLFTWGDNSSGQLGVGSKESHFVPVLVTSLKGVPLKQIAAGARHSCAVTVGGTVFCWGDNSYGQCGIPDKSECIWPARCKALKNQGVSTVVCGAEHTVALTVDGGVFTFGRGDSGQLGHSSLDSEPLPRKVAELMGSVVIGVAAARWHTTILTETSRVYRFGVCSVSPPGSRESHFDPPGDARKRSTLAFPDLVHGPWSDAKGAFAGQSLVEHSTRRPHPVRLVAGPLAITSYVLFSTTFPPLDMREFEHILQNVDLQRVLQLTSPGGAHGSTQRPLSSVNSIPADLVEEVEAIFSNPATLNSSFLPADTILCSAKRCNINVDEVMEAMKRTSEYKAQRVEDVMMSAIRDHLLPSLPVSPPDIEGLRLYMIVPFVRALRNDVHAYVNTTCPLACCIMRLEGAAAKVLDAWWGHLTSSQLTWLIDMYKTVLTHLSGLASSSGGTNTDVLRKCKIYCLQLLKKTYDINESNNQIVPYTSFYIPVLTNSLDLKQEFFKWLVVTKMPAERMAADSLLRSEVLFVNFPFIFDGPAKSTLLRCEQSVSMQEEFNRIQHENIAVLFGGAHSRAASPVLFLNVDREDIVTSTLNELAKAGNAPGTFRKPMKVQFKNEEGDDAGGVRKEFFLLLIRELVDPKWGMFVENDRSHLLWFAERTFESAYMYALVGTVCGLAIYNSVIVSLPFPLALYKKLLNQPIGLDDLREFDPVQANSLSQLLAYEEDDFCDIFPLNFEITRDIFGEVVTTELIPHGSKEAVTLGNKHKYVDAYCDFVLNKASAVKESFDAFSAGFHRVVDSDGLLRLFHAQELQAMVVGNEHYDWNLLRESCEYKSGYTESSLPVRWFWTVFDEMSVRQRKAFLMFLTGCDRIPIEGMKAVKMKIQPMPQTEEQLPVAHTCFNLLDLPRYPSIDILRAKLLTAIENAHGFGLA